MPNVSLISSSYDPQQIVAAAARLCYSDIGVGELLDGMDEEKTKKLIGLLMDLGHESPIEHASFTFAIEDVSRSFLAQITRHRIASFSVQSQRYVNMSNPKFIIPPAIMDDECAKAVYLQSMEDAAKAYRNIADTLKSKYKKKLLEEGKSDKKAQVEAEKMAIEDARFVLPNAACTKMIVTMNARSLLNFFRLRCCTRAQWEIREVANLMLREVKKTAPLIFQNAGPACITGPCPEGDMSCKQAVEMRRLYSREGSAEG